MHGVARCTRLHATLHVKKPVPLRFVTYRAAKKNCLKKENILFAVDLLVMADVVYICRFIFLEFLFVPALILLAAYTSQTPIFFLLSLSSPSLSICIASIVYISSPPSPQFLCPIWHRTRSCHATAMSPSKKSCAQAYKVD